MVHLIKGILTKEECETLTKQFDVDKKINPSFDKLIHTGNSYGFEPSYIFNQYLDKLKSKILEINSNIDDLTNVNAFVREYKNNDFLKKHIDRTDISTTISICLESTINKEWPICAEINNQPHCFNMDTGDGILLFNADKIVHWRDVLICNENERVLQFFLHWIPVNYLIKKTKTII
jgi:hypothetical protein